MGYKKSFNLVTLQLIIPLSTMTKAEYKATYGIDLDDIDIEKVTLLQEDGGKNKYFVDEVKTTENGVDIYAGGKILSIGSSVSVTENAYSVENAKPIYCHPILIVNSSDVNVRFSLNLFIFDNSSTAYNKSSLVSKMKDLDEVSWITTGAYCTVDATLYFSPSAIRYASEKLALYGVDNAGNFHSGAQNFIDMENLINLETTIVIDGVNKIN